MSREERISEIIASMPSFSKEAYNNEELLSELLALQTDVVRLTFNGEHAETADLKIWDVEKHLSSLNEESGHIADSELEVFQAENKKLRNLISSEISGKAGESKAFSILDNLNSDSIILKNIELGDDSQHTEIDAIVIKSGHIFIIEVKNTKKSVFIDEKSDYFIDGNNFQRRDCNIGNKLNLKQRLLKEALRGTEFSDVPIRCFVVFTNENIEIHNVSHWVKTCFVSQLAYVINSYVEEPLLSDEEMNLIAEQIKKTEIKRRYPARFDVMNYKRVFATLMSTLEEAANEECAIDEEGLKVDCTTQSEDVKTEGIMVVLEKVKNALTSPTARYIEAGFAGAIITCVFQNAIKRLR